MLDYSRLLCDALDEHDGVESSLVILGEYGRAQVRSHGRERLLSRAAAMAQLCGSSWTIIQYSPFAYGRWGFAPWLVSLAGALRVTTKVGLVVHEPYVASAPGRQRLMSAWQRGQLSVLGVASAKTFVSTGPWVEVVRRDASSTPTVHLPVGSNLPDAGDARASVRRRLGIGPDNIVIVTFGTGHDSTLYAHIQAALKATSDAGVSVHYMQLGTGPAIDPGCSARVIRPGWLPAQDAAEHLAAGDVLLAPFIDGVSTRRTTVAAAAQHRVAVMTTMGTSTGSSERWRDAGFTLVPAPDVEGFAAATAALACDAERRQRAGNALRAYYETQISWAAISARMISELRQVEQPA